MFNIIDLFRKKFKLNSESFGDILFVNKAPSFFKENYQKENFLLFTKKGNYHFQKHCPCGDDDCLDNNQIIFKATEPPTNWEEVGLPNFKKEWHEC
jgi:hypothetical protein